MNHQNDFKVGIIWIEYKGFTPTHGYQFIGDKVEFVELNNLNPQYFWLSNLKSNLFRQSELSSYGIHHSQYFRVSLSEICVELNLPNDVFKKLPILFKILNLVADRLTHNFDVSLSSHPFTILEPLKNLLAPFTASQYPVLNGEPSRELDFAIDNSHQKLQVNKQKFTTKQKDIATLYIPRTPFSLLLLNQKYPCSANYNIDMSLDSRSAGYANGSLMPDTDDIISYFKEISESKAGFVHFTLLDTDKKYAQVFNLGQEVSKIKLRSWATLPEIVELLNYNHLTIHQMYLTQAANLPNCPDFPETSSFMSYANGIVNEIIWASISYQKQSDKKVDPICPYLRSYDRMITTQYVKKLTDLGFQVSGFSLGSIRIYLNKKDIKARNQLRDIAIQNSLIPQFSMLS